MIMTVTYDGQVSIKLNREEYNNLRLIAHHVQKLEPPDEAIDAFCSEILADISAAEKVIGSGVYKEYYPKRDDANLKVEDKL